MTSPPLLAVAAVALVDGAGRILMQRLPDGVANGGLWEFPGGKLEPGETATEAAVRELAEELDVVIAADALVPVGLASGRTDAGRPIRLLLFACRAWTGEPVAHAAQALAWFTRDALDTLPIPPLDRELIALLDG